MIWTLVLSASSRTKVSKKPRYSCGSTASAASQSEDNTATDVSSCTSALDDNDSGFPRRLNIHLRNACSLPTPTSPGDAFIDDVDSDEDISSRRKSKLKPSKSVNSKSSSASLWTTAEKAKQGAKLQVESKQAPWKFLRDIRDVRIWCLDFTFTTLLWRA